MGRPIGTKTQCSKSHQIGNLFGDFRASFPLSPFAQKSLPKQRRRERGKAVHHHRRGKGGGEPERRRKGSPQSSPTLSDDKPTRNTFQRLLHTKPPKPTEPKTPTPLFTGLLAGLHWSGRRGGGKTCSQCLHDIQVNQHSKLHFYIFPSAHELPFKHGLVYEHTCSYKIRTRESPGRLFSETEKKRSGSGGS